MFAVGSEDVEEEAEEDGVLAGGDAAEPEAERRAAEELALLVLRVGSADGRDGVDGARCERAGDGDAVLPDVRVDKERPPPRARAREPAAHGPVEQHAAQRALARVHRAARDHPRALRPRCALRLELSVQSQALGNSRCLGNFCLWVCKVKGDVRKLWEKRSDKLVLLAPPWMRRRQPVHV